MGNLYFLEKRMIERMREVQRQAEFRSRLGLRYWRGEPMPRCLRRLVGGWFGGDAEHRCKGALRDSAQHDVMEDPGRRFRTKS